jgi:AMP-binding enzyme/AMP-binding enzyme C-terminal domain
VVLNLTPGNVVTAPRSDMMFVVTEFGLVNLNDLVECITTDAQLRAAAEAGGTYCVDAIAPVVLTGEVAIGTNLVLNSTGPGNATIDANQVGRAFSVTGNLTLNNISVTNGRVHGLGGAIRVITGSVTLAGTTEVKNSSAWLGGGVSVSDTFDRAGSTLIMRDLASVHDNLATSFGENVGLAAGGVFANQFGSVVMNDSSSITKNANDGNYSGGGMLINGANLTMNGTSVISQNSVPNGRGGGIYFANGGSISMGVGASPMPQVLIEKLAELYPALNLWQVYGMTEASVLLTVLSAEDHRAGGPRLRAAGAPVPGVVLSIQDIDGEELGVGETGEVCACGGNFMLEYWNKPEATAEAFAGGWYHSGDAGYLDDDGYLFLVDRAKDMIVTGGENVYSAEVENALAGHPAVQQVAVIGIPSNKWGEAVHAIVVLRSGAVTTEIELIAHARQLIAGYKVPKSVTFRTDPLPLSGAMKVLKRELRAPYWEGHDRNVG